MVTPLADPPQRLAVAARLDEPASYATILRLPSRLSALSVVQRHVLACVAVHHWNFEGNIEYFPPTAQQERAARWLAGPDLRLLQMWGKRWPSFGLTRLGELIAQRVLRLVPAVEDMAREVEFDRMRALMRNRWETNDDEE